MEILRGPGGLLPAVILIVPVAQVEPERALLAVAGHLALGSPVFRAQAAQAGTALFLVQTTAGVEVVGFLLGVLEPLTLLGEVPWVQCPQQAMIDPALRGSISLGVWAQQPAVLHIIIKYEFNCYVICPYYYRCRCT